MKVSGWTARVIDAQNPVHAFWETIMDYAWNGDPPDGWVMSVTCSEPYQHQMRFASGGVFYCSEIILGQEVADIRYSSIIKKLQTISIFELPTAEQQDWRPDHSIPEDYYAA